MFQLDVEAHTLLHRQTGAAISPAGVSFDTQKESWALENNYNERSAKLKNQILGISFTVISLFRSAGTPLPKHVKIPMASLSQTDTTEAASSSANPSEAGRRQALLDRPKKLLPLTEGEPTPEKTAQQTARPARQQLVRGPDGRVRLSGVKRLGDEHTAEPGVQPSRRLRRKTTEEEVLATPTASESAFSSRQKEEETKAAEDELVAAARLTPVSTETLAEENTREFSSKEKETTAAENDRVTPATPSPVATEVADEENSVAANRDLEDGTENTAPEDGMENAALERATELSELGSSDAEW